MKIIRAGITALTIAATAAVGYVVADKYGLNTPAYAAAALEIGQPLPDFKLKDADGKEHALESYKGKVVVLNFSSPNCPVSRGLDPEINKLAAKYKDNPDVVFLGVDANKNVTPEDLAKHISETNQPYPILKDEGNKYADAVGAKVTPELFIAGKDGKLVYHGALDARTSHTEKDGGEPHADNAIQAALEGKPAPVAEVKAFGCGIKRGS
jgi:peroxiredoxin